MASKPRAPRKASISSKDAPPKSQNSMPPPPNPPQPPGILVLEGAALSTCLRNAVVKTAQVYSFYADIKRLNIQTHTSYPPHTLLASLGREVEKYGQLCDAIETQLLHTITVLQRDLSLARDRLKAAKAVPIPTSPAHSEIYQPSLSSPSQPPPADDGATQSDLKTPGVTRRSSTISLSSLHRPPFPHKLDLSSPGMRINPDDPLTLQSGLASPVMLAPKSSISRHPSELLGGARPVDIDLTLEDSDISIPPGPLPNPAVNSLGNSADKPIELDLDIEMELFSSSHPNPDGRPSSTGSPMITPKQEDTGLDLSLLSGVGLNGSSFLAYHPTEVPQPSNERPGNHSGNFGTQHNQLPASSSASLIPGANFDFGLNFLETGGYADGQLTRDQSSQWEL